MVPGPGRPLVLVGEAGQVLGDGGSGLRPAVVKIIRWTVFYSDRNSSYLSIIIIVNGQKFKAFLFLSSY